MLDGSAAKALARAPLPSIGTFEPAPKTTRKGAGRRLPVRLGEYELFDHVARGGMADIYRARRDGEFGVVREVCVKEVLPELSASDRLAGLLTDEAKIAAKLDHANIVRIEDLRHEAETLFIAMEFVDGLDLRELLRGAAKLKLKIPPEIALHVSMEILRALQYAHTFRFEGETGESVGIVHRDVSPSNVLLSFEGEVKLCDFGIAKSYEGLDDRAADQELSAGMVEGKAGYMSPEQARGEPLDGRADVFAAGIILWELCTGRKLYKASEGQSLFDIARRGAVKPLPELGLPSEHVLANIVERALARNREDRYGSAEEMLEDLERYAMRAKLVTGATALRRFLESHFAEAARRTRRRRELATSALARGPAATITEIPRASVDVSDSPWLKPLPAPAPRPTWRAVAVLLVAAAVLFATVLALR
ncbi:MAG: serine/threonine protein kinase [Myxococcales bacterium]|nr:serine/threonine protein kinase [Myxococcales bacterium]